MEGRGHGSGTRGLGEWRLRGLWGLALMGLGVENCRVVPSARAVRSARCAWRRWFGRLEGL